ncbi:MAG: hypothetical protein GEU71_03660 [Actinobacteria bacterium]|nr:hypothetical protein [Actinomycetota bacterium]
MSRTTQEIEQEIVETPEEDEIAELKRELASLKRMVQEGRLAPELATPTVAAASVALDQRKFENQKRVLEEHWATEPRVMIQIEPNQVEKQILAIKGAYPPRRHQVNGVVVWLEVGKMIEVPKSIAELHLHTRKEPAIKSIPAGEMRVGYYVGDSFPGVG